VVRSLHAGSVGPTGTAGGTRCSIAASRMCFTGQKENENELSKNELRAYAIILPQYTHISLALIDFTQATFALLFVMVRICFMF